MNEQPEALRIAYVIEGGWDREHGRKAAAELRRLYEENERLKEEIKTEQALSFRNQVFTLEAALRQALEALERGETQLRYQAIAAAQQALREQA